MIKELYKEEQQLLKQAKKFAMGKSLSHHHDEHSHSNPHIISQRIVSSTRKSSRSIKRWNPQHTCGFMPHVNISTLQIAELNARMQTLPKILEEQQAQVPTQMSSFTYANPSVV